MVGGAPFQQQLVCRVADLLSHSELLFSSWSESTHHFLYEVLSLLGKAVVAEACLGLKMLNYMVVEKQTSALLQHHLLLSPTNPVKEC